MPVQLSRDTVTVLRQYADGEISIAELVDWLVQVEYDPDMPEDERNILAGIRLTQIEVSEGLRPNKDDILACVAAALALSAPDTTVVTVRSGSTTTWDREPTFTAGPSGVQRVGISA